MTKGMSVDECIQNVENFIGSRGACLLLFDVRGSRNFENPKNLVDILSQMMKDINQKFGKYFPEHELAAYSRKEKGFQFLLGDGSWTGINSANIIGEIVDYQMKNYPNIHLYWGVAKDGYDDERIKIVK